MPKRINVTIPEQIASDIQTIAAVKGTSDVDVMKQCIKLGVAVLKAQQSGAKFIVVEDGEEAEIVFV